MTPDERDVFERMMSSICAVAADYSHPNFTDRHGDGPRLLLLWEEAHRMLNPHTVQVEPCRLCKRRVSIPCHSLDSMYQNGPWDKWGGDVR
jgi:hypothetical protein